MEKTLEEKRAYVQKPRPIDDVFFEVLAEDPAVMQEMHCVILADPELTVISVTPQRDVANSMGRAVRLDAWCHLGDGCECDVEVQRADDDDHVRRVRYNASGITWTKTNKGVNFEEIPDVCIVYISQFDFLGGGRTTYHVDKVIRETGVTVNDGLSEVYVNTKIDDGSDIANLMKCFLQEQVNNPKFPKLSARINERELPAVKTAGFGGFSTSFELPSTVSYTQMTVMRRKSGA